MWYFVFQFWWLILLGGILTIIIYNAIKNANQQNAGKNSQQTYYQPPQRNTMTNSAYSKQSSPPYQSQQPHYQPYDQGYQPSQTVSQQKAPLYTPFQPEEQEQKAEARYDEYDQPKAEYPQQMPPM
jgi:hypothetical protein